MSIGRHWCRNVLAALCAAVGISAPALAQGDVVISQVYGSGGTASQPNADYVELMNRTNAPVNIGGWSLQVATSSTGTAWAKFDIPAGTTLQPGQYFLIQVGATSGTTSVPLPTPDGTFSPTVTSLTTSGKVALRRNTTLIGGTGVGGQPPGSACPGNDGFTADLITYGTTTTATCFEGGGRAPLQTTATASTRANGGCTDTNNNNTDFSNITPNPRNTSSPITDCFAAPGVCCNDTTGACTITTGAGPCTASGGTFDGLQTTCGPTSCPEARACCTGTTFTTCSLRTQASCASVSGFWGSAGSTCTPTNFCGSAVSCCLPDGTCCALGAAYCTSIGGTPGTSTSCTTAGSTNCQSGIVPVNDTCAAAIPLSVFVPVIGNNFGATTTGETFNTNCSTIQASKGVWYTFTPATTSVFEISTCGTLFDNILGVYTIGNCNDNTTWTAIACDDDACPTGSASFCGTTSSASAALIGGVQLQGGVTYHILLANDSTTATIGGNFRILVTDLGAVAVGACCTNGSCVLTTSLGCTAATPAGTYSGDNTTCTPGLCGNAGACCFSGGICAVRLDTACTGTNIFNPGVTCSAAPCVVGSCCVPCTLACTITAQSNCAATSTWTLDGTCTPNSCAASTLPPANDQPAGAITLSVGVQVTGQNPNATDTNDGPNSTCDTTVSRGMWYNFTPAASGYFSVSTCGSTHDTVLTVFSDDLSTILACDADTCVGGSSDTPVCGTTSPSTTAAVISAVFLQASTQYKIRVQSGGTTTFGTFGLIVNSTSGEACCNDTTGACTVAPTGACPTGTTGQGTSSVCGPTTCPAVGSCCDPCTFACTTTIQAVCTGTWTEAGSCSPNVCGGAAPANDTACGAIAVTLGSQVVGQLAGATSTDDGPGATCDTTGNKGVWYSFTPDATGNYTVSTCGAVFDTILTVFSGNCATPASLTQIACDDDACTGTGDVPVCNATASSLASIVPLVQLQGGTTYLVRIQVAGTTAVGGTFPLLITQVTNAGACCTNAAVCTFTTQDQCTATTSVFVPNVTCDPFPCPQLGACCNSCTFACTITYQVNCSSDVPWQANVACTPTNPCGPGVPANDQSSGAIALSLGVQVIGQNVNATDTNDGTPSCDTTVSRGMWYSFTPTTSGYYSVSTCGASHDTVLTVLLSDTVTEVACDADACAGTGDVPVCGTTASASAAVINFVFLDANTTYLIRVSSGGTTTFGTFPLIINSAQGGACCANTTGACTVTSPTGCTSGVYQGDNTVCNPSPCPPTGSCCNTCTFACTVTLQANCAAGSVWTQGGTCTVNPCGGPAPGNDTACGAIPLTLNTTVTSNNAGATSTDDGPVDTCSTLGNKGVWYSFTPAATGDYTITTCGATFDSHVAVFTGDCNTPSAFVQVACDADACLGSTRDTVVCGSAAANASAGVIASVNLQQGVVYFIRVQVDSTTAVGGTFPITVKPATTGSCCTPAGGCTVVVTELCANANVWISGGTCQAGGCPPTGACCDTCGNCVVAFASNCTSPSLYQGDGSTCTIVCPGAGAPANDLCANATVITTFPFVTSGCSENATGDGPIGTCQSFGAPPSLLFSVWYKYTATQPGTINASVDFIVWQGNRLANVFATTDGSCPTDNSQQLLCGTTDPQNFSFNVTPGTTYFIVVADEGTITDDEGGSFNLTVNFTPAGVVCCRGSTCAFVPASECVASTTPVVGAAVSPAAACGVTNSPTGGCCFADFNKQGGVTIDDIFIYLNAWFASSDFANVGAPGTPNIDDIFIFLNAWFAGCP
jgi:hypothetical protein